ncbi:MAG: uroporphyrinogen-III synthase [Nocardioidaceae bacterium]
MSTDLPLAGYRVGVTAARRQDELVALLERKGAEVTCAAAMRIAPLDDDADLLAATRACLEQPPDFVMATTGIGFRSWCEAADGWGLGDDLRSALGAATVLARGPKTVGAIRAAGLRESWSPEYESLQEVVDRLLTYDLRGRRVALQEHGEPAAAATQTLRAQGAEVVTVTVYRWETVADQRPVTRLLDRVMQREIDALTFTSAPGASAFLEVADRGGRLGDLVDALRSDVLAACVGPVTAAPIERLGVRTVQPERGRLGALVRELVLHLTERRVATIDLPGRSIDVRAGAVVVDGRPVPLSPVPRAVLTALAEHPGRVLSRQELLRCLPSASSEHAVEVAVARLREAVGADLVQTVVKRGYRLAVTA